MVQRQKSGADKVDGDCQEHHDKVDEQDRKCFFQAQRIAFQMFVHIQHLTSLPALR